MYPPNPSLYHMMYMICFSKFLNAQILRDFAIKDSFTIDGPAEYTDNVSTRMHVDQQKKHAFKIGSIFLTYR